MLLFKNASLGIILALLVLVLCEADDDKDKEEEEEKDPWDKSTDKYRHKLGETGVGTHHEEEPVKIDVTEVSESEVHSERSKVCKNCKPAKPKARTHAPKGAILNATKQRKKPDAAQAQDFVKNDVDAETKEQIDDATDEQDPAADAKVREPKVAAKDKKSNSKKKGGVASKIKSVSHKGKSVSEIGSSWDTPCFYNSDTNKFSCKQLIPAHYYGPPSAGWGGFQPGQTGGGWGTPHWNKKCHTPEAKCRTYYKVPSSSKMFVGKGGSWDSDTYRYNNGVQYPYSESPAIRFKVSRPEETINRITPLVTNPKIYGSRNNIAALHEWIKFLQNEREKDRMLERFRLEMKDKENQRRYNLEVIRYKQAQVSEQTRLSQLTGRSIAPHVDSRQIKYYTKPQLEEQEFEKKAVQYVLSHNAMQAPLYNDR